MTITEIHKEIARLQSERSKLHPVRNAIKYLQISQQIDALANVQECARIRMSDIREYMTPEQSTTANSLLIKILILADMIETSAMDFTEILKATRPDLIEVGILVQCKEMAKVSKAIRKEIEKVHSDKIQSMFGDLCDNLDEMVNNKVKAFNRKVATQMEKE